MLLLNRIIAPHINCLVESDRFSRCTLRNDCLFTGSNDPQVPVKNIYNFILLQAKEYVIFELEINQIKIILYIVYSSFTLVVAIQTSLFGAMTVEFFNLAETHVHFRLSQLDIAYHSLWTGASRHCDNT